MIKILFVALIYTGGLATGLLVGLLYAKGQALDAWRRGWDACSAAAELRAVLGHDPSARLRPSRPPAGAHEN